MIYNIVLVSGVQQSASDIYIYIFFFFSISQNVYESYREQHGLLAEIQYFMEKTYCRIIHTKFDTMFYKNTIVLKLSIVVNFGEKKEEMGKFAQQSYWQGSSC